MARKLRIQYPGAIYHVMNRGDRREDIYSDDKDRKRFLETLAETCTKTQWQVHAFVLMANHFHLVLETPEPNLVDGMKWFLGTYTSRFNRRHKVFGHLFSGRYKALIVEGSGNGYLKTVGDYVHLNPVRARLLSPEQPLESFGWSSYPLYLDPSKRSCWLRVDRLLGEWGIPKDSSAGREQFARSMENLRASEDHGQFKMLRRGWCVGSEEFRKELLAQVDHNRGKWHYGAELHESAESKAERLIQRALELKGWTEQDLQLRSKGDGFKVEVALRLRAQTTMTLGWIAKRLCMGTRGNVTQLLHWATHPQPTQPETNSDQQQFKLID
jgi:REP element-mobilizing transposase RayT